MSGHRLHLNLLHYTGATVVGTIDMTNHLDWPVFEPLKDQNVFDKVFIDGDTVCWTVTDEVGDEYEVDIAPEWLYEQLQDDFN